MTTELLKRLRSPMKETYEADCREAAREITTLYDALIRYGNHLHYCPKGHEDGAGGEASARQACTCGFYKVQIEVLELKPRDSSKMTVPFVDEVE